MKQEIKLKYPKVRVRFAPSPTGYLHIGGLRTYLFSYLIAKKYGGDIILRIEDTDTDRFVPGATEALINVLNNDLSIGYDEGPFFEDGAIMHRGAYGPYIQSERLDLYQNYAKKLIEEGRAYHCFCTEERLKQVREEQIARKEAPGYDKHCRTVTSDEATQRIGKGEKSVIRLRVPAGKTTYTDLLRGEITVDNHTIDDQVLIKSNGYPTYHLAVVVDDHLMDITLVTRAEEWLPSTPKHVMLYGMLRWDAPEFLHFPILVDEQRRKLSKRAMDVSVQSILAKGYLPEALINFSALLGWHPQGDEEILTLSEIIERFTLDRLQKGAAFFDMEKLTWLNTQWIKKMDTERLGDLIGAEIMPGAIYRDAKANNLFFWPVKNSSTTITIPIMQYYRMIDSIRDRLRTIAEAESMLDFFFTLPEYEPDILTKKSDQSSAKQMLKWCNEIIKDLGGKSNDIAITAAELKNDLMHKIESAGLQRGEVLWPLRVAVTGMAQSPDVFAVIAALGTQETLRRIGLAITALSS